MSYLLSNVTLLYRLEILHILQEPEVCNTPRGKSPCVGNISKNPIFEAKKHFKGLDELSMKRFIFNLCALDVGVRNRKN